MSSSSKKPKQPVTNYNMSVHFGLAHLLDKLLRVRVNDKNIWTGELTGNAVLNIDLPGLFGGVKKEGGVRGRIHCLFGGGDQLLSDELAGKINPGSTGATTPAFRGLTSLFFTGGGPERKAGFLWLSNSPYMRHVDVTVQRAPKGFYPEKALVPRYMSPPGTDHGMLGAHNLDINGSHPEFDPAAVSSPSWEVNFGATSEIGAFDYQTSEPLPQEVTVYGGGEWHLWSQEPIERQVPFNPQQVLELVFDGNDGTRWDYESSFGSLNNAIRFPYEKTGVTVDFIDSVGSTVLSVSIWSTIKFGFPGVPTKSVVASFTAVNSGVSWSMPYPEDNGHIASTVSVQMTFSASGATLVFSGGGRSYTQSVEFGTLDTKSFVYRTTQNRYFTISPEVQSGKTGSYLRIIDTVPIGIAADANPAHIIYECLTDTDWGLGLPPTSIDLDSFTSAADTLYSEALGLSMMWSTQTQIEGFVNEVLKHIDGTYGIDPSSGKIYLSLIRGGYELSSLPILDEDNCRIVNFARKAMGETVNEVVVTWTNPENEKEETVVVHDLANYSIQGALVSNSSNYYGVRTAELAMRLALRDLTRSAYPVATFEIEANRSALRYKSGDVIKLSYPEYGLLELPVRILTVNYGTPGQSKVSISAIEDVFTLPATAYFDVVASADPNDNIPVVPLNAKFTLATAAPYYILARQLGSAAAAEVPQTSAYSVILAAQDSASALSFDIAEQVTNALGVTSYEVQTNILGAAHAVLGAQLSPEPVSTGVALTKLYQGSPEIGGLAWIGSSDAGYTELAVVESIEPLILRRGMLDTTPGTWPVGSPIWFIGAESDFSDGKERLVGSTVNYKVLTRTSLGVLPQDLAPVLPADISARQHRPYRPADVKVNGLYWPVVIDGVDVLTVTYSRRNRLLEDPEIKLWTAADVTPEFGTTYSARLHRLDTGALLTETTGVSGNSIALTSTYTGLVKLELFAVRDGLQSFQSFTHIFEHVPGGLRATETGEIRITEDGENRALEA